MRLQQLIEFSLHHSAPICGKKAAKTRLSLGCVRLAAMQRVTPMAWFLIGVLLISSAVVWYWRAGTTACATCIPPAPQNAVVLTSGAVAGMDSPFFAYSPGWQVSAGGADPAEPANPFEQPAGVVTFPYTGADLYLLIAPGDYWGYLYVTVDGQPANRVPVIAGNFNSQGEAAGYTTLLAPERVPDGGGEPPPHWLLVQQGSGESAHNVRIEVWRGWGQTPLRAVAVDPPANALVELDSLAQQSSVRWPAVLVMGLGFWLAAAGGRRWLVGRKMTWRSAQRLAVPKRLAAAAPQYAAALAAGGLLLVAGSVAIGGTVPANWLLCVAGLLLLALAGLLRPALWWSALLFGLPFAFGVKLPLLPTRSFDLIDVGVWGGAVLLALHWAGAYWISGGAVPDDTFQPATRKSYTSWPLLALAAIVTWALVAAAAARYPDLALREWRVVFLNALVFGGALALSLRLAPPAATERRLLMTAWLAGGAAVSLFGLWGYATGSDFVTQAEGVRRIQAFYGSANNLALYLDRTVAVSLALVLFARKRRLLWALLALPQLPAWLLTFSKGSLLLAAPAMALVLLIGGGQLLRRQGRPLRPLWLLLGVAALAVLLLTPFGGAERFQRLFDLSEGTGFLRLQLWRSSWQMALDHLLLGVGPDNFLYVYRSSYLLPAAWQEPNLNHPHNLLLDWWTRLGLPGLLLGLAWLGSGTAAAVRRLRCGRDAALALGVLAAIAAALAHGLIDVSYALPELMIVWVLLFGVSVARCDD